MNATEDEKLEAKRLLWELGELSWKLRPEQAKFKTEIENLDKQLIVGNISRRWGKSFTLVLYAIEQAIQTKQRIRYAAAFKTDLEEFILPAFEQILDDCPEELRPTYHVSKQEWRFPNGSVVKLVGLDKNKNGLRGNAINIIILDEAGFVANLKYQYTTVIIPATAKQTNIKIIVISTPPESPDHYFCELITKAQTSDTGYYLCLTIDDISDLTPEERKRLLDEVGGETSTTAQREFFCKIIVDSTRSIAPSFNASLHVKAVEPQHIRWMLFGDSGAIDKTVFLEAGYCHSTDKLIFRSELHFKPETPTSEIVNEVKHKWPDQLSLILDATKQLLIDYSSLGLAASLPMKDDFGAGLLLLNNALHNDKLIIHPDCKLLIRTLEAGLLNRARTDYERTASLGHCDAAATAIYALRCADRQTDLRPKPDPTKIWTSNREPDLHQRLKELSFNGSRKL